MKVHLRCILKLSLAERKIPYSTIDNLSALHIEPKVSFEFFFFCNMYGKFSIIILN